MVHSDLAQSQSPSGPILIPGLVAMFPHRVWDARFDRCVFAFSVPPSRCAAQLPYWTDLIDHVDRKQRADEESTFNGDESRTVTTGDPFDERFSHNRNNRTNKTRPISFFAVFFCSPESPAFRIPTWLVDRCVFALPSPRPICSP